MESATRAVQRDLLRRNRGLRAWRRRPLLWLAVVLLLGALLTLSLRADSSDEVRTQRHGDLVEATVLPSWDGGGSVPVRYRNPSTGHVREIVVPEDFDTVHHVGPIRLRVTPDHEDEGRPVGSRAAAHVVTDSRIMIDGEADRTTWISGVIWTAGISCLLGAWAWSRFRRVRRGADVLAASSTPSARLTAVPRRGMILPRRWTFALFDANAGPDATSIGRLRVSPQAGPPGPRVVEVLGDADRWRRCVFVEPGTGLCWVPLGRPWRQHVQWPSAAATRLDRWRPTGLLLLVIGVGLLITGGVLSRDPIGELEARSDLVTVQLQESVPADGGTVGVGYRSGGANRRATVHLGGPQREGSRVRLRVDRDHPTSLWQDGTSSPPVTRDNHWSDLLTTCGSLVAIGGLFLFRRPRTPKEVGNWPVATLDPAWTGQPADPVQMANWSYPTASSGDPTRPGWVPPPTPPTSWPLPSGWSPPPPVGPVPPSPPPPPSTPLPPPDPAPPPPPPSAPLPPPDPAPSRPPAPLAAPPAPIKPEARPKPVPPHRSGSTPDPGHHPGPDTRPPVIRLPGTLSLPDAPKSPDAAADGHDEDAPPGP